MANRLRAVDAKIARGYAHLREMDSLIEAYFESQPTRVSHEEVAADTFVGRFRVDREPPTEIAIVAGEAIRQFRSSLDHLMAQLVWLVDPLDPDPPTFPIHIRKVEYDRKVRKAVSATSNVPTSPSMS